MSTRAPRLPSGSSAPLLRRAVPHGVSCEYPEYPTGGTASVRGTHGALEYRRGTFWVGAGASFCAACGMQASGNGGLVGIDSGGTGHVSVVGSTLTSISVRARCLSTP